MALDENELIELEKAIAAAEGRASSFNELRRRFPHLALVRCDASDVSEPPFRSFPQLDLHLIDRSDHCVQITADPARAIGIILAARGPLG
ncbi:hypothetical protein JJB98_28720 [Bradyrhizobium diazoefficiens]|nr:hypothetical protein [Bradyrhizobium diazoefficiens]QQO23617.1 hypothetical protein JJB98_28720 [Bradyrhizobium diazoefficiens]